MLGCKCLRLIGKKEKEEEKQGWRGKGYRMRRKKKRKYQIKNRKSQILEHAFIFPKLLFKKQKKEII